MGASERPLHLTSISFCGKRKTPIVAIGALLSFNYVSIKPVMSSKSRYMVGSKSRWAKKQTIPYVQSAPRMSTCLPPPPSKLTASRNTDYRHTCSPDTAGFQKTTLSVFKQTSVPVRLYTSTWEAANSNLDQTDGYPGWCISMYLQRKCLKIGKIHILEYGWLSFMDIVWTLRKSVLGQ